EGDVAPRLRARDQGLGASPRARQLHPGGGGVPRPRRVRDLRRQRPPDLRDLPAAQRLARRPLRALAALAPARAAAARRPGGGPANAVPREWARAWQVCRAGDGERMEQVHEVLRAFGAATEFEGRKRAIAAFKRALLRLGVIQSAAVATGTPALASEEERRFD